MAATLIASDAACPAQALPARSIDPLVREFAYCAGRLSAEMEHQWLLSDPASDRTAVQRRAMLSLLEAASPPDQGRDLLHLRISAKFAHADLLRRASFDPDPESANRARLRAEVELAHCLALILS
ncbi:hypothetical protein SAMN04487991_1584 [Celeribacter neptunius]|uniref:Uncharacterized protein n=2 Tax=Celeribacter neptunius TaxID=588602 RepID=A0A1I3P7C4_9RHOB|nr:hypothetical protein SAMN04487991_1584 [Celeribacter neptunius]